MVSGTENDAVPRVDYNKAVRRFKRPSVNLQRGETFTADEIRPPPVPDLPSFRFQRQMLPGR
jgi:hypothetical protein